MLKSRILADEGLHPCCLICDRKFLFKDTYADEMLECYVTYNEILGLQDDIDDYQEEFNAVEEELEEINLKIGQLNPEQEEVLQAEIEAIRSEIKEEKEEILRMQDREDAID